MAFDWISEGTRKRQAIRICDNPIPRIHVATPPANHSYHARGTAAIMPQLPKWTVRVKHFEVTATDTDLSFTRKADQIDEEALFDGIADVKLQEEVFAIARATCRPQTDEAPAPGGKRGLEKVW